ncbi:MAG: hypothetical protein M1326_09070 [Cyanobacteria bacterium]|nr:hypothetical protein [Cyanobacteriota bacterium]
MGRLDLNTLFNILEEMAKKQADGHITILKFTTDWKVAFSTPDFDSGDGREQISKLKNYDTLEEAIKDLLIKRIKLDDISN